jgi:TIR domain
MTKQCIISHAHVDADIARALAVLIERVSLSSMKVWHSSDDRRSGGVGAGQQWFETIIDKLRTGRVIIALITQQGGNKPWIYFESGFAAGQAEMTVIPVAVGLKDANEIPAPLSAYQSYALIDQRSVSKFLEKLLALFDVKFDDEMSQVPMSAFVSEIARLQSVEHGRSPSPDTSAPASSPSGGSQFDPNLILAHIDRRLNDFVEAAKGQHVETDYAVEFSIQFPKLNTTTSLSIGTDDSVQSILNALWSMLSDHVKPYSYMENWILQEKNNGAYLVIREVAALIPARYIFRHDLHWIAKPLNKAYTAAGGGERTMTLQDTWDRRKS